MTADPDRLAAARLLLDQLGVTLADLQDSAPGTPGVPTVTVYLPRVIAAASPSTGRTYGPYWTRMAEAWGEKPLTAINSVTVWEAVRLASNELRLSCVRETPASAASRRFFARSIRASRSASSLVLVNPSTLARP